MEYYLSKLLTYKKEGLIRDLIQKLKPRQLEVAGQRECYRSGSWESADP